MMEMARGNLEQARLSLPQARMMVTEGNWALCIARSAEAVEFSLKAAIRSVGGSFKREHDITRDLITTSNVGAFPSWFQARVARFTLVARILALLFMYPRYGHEELQTPASALFTEAEASAYLQAAEEIFTACEQLVREMEHP